MRKTRSVNELIADATTDNASLRLLLSSLFSRASRAPIIFLTSIPNTPSVGSVLTSCSKQASTSGSTATLTSTLTSSSDFTSPALALEVGPWIPLDDEIGDTVNACGAGREEPANAIEKRLHSKVNFRCRCDGCGRHVMWAPRHSSCMGFELISFCNEKPAKRII